MNHLDLENTLQWVTVDGPEAITDDALSAAVDLKDYIGQVRVGIVVADNGGTTPTLDVTIHESDASGGSYAAVSGLAFTQITTTASIQWLTIDTRDVKQFIKVDWDTGGTPDYTIAAVLVGRKQVL